MSSKKWTSMLAIAVISAALVACADNNSSDNGDGPNGNGDYSRFTGLWVAVGYKSVYKGYGVARQRNHAAAFCNGQYNRRAVSALAIKTSGYVFRYNPMDRQYYTGGKPYYPYMGKVGDDGFFFRARPSNAPRYDHFVVNVPNRYFRNSAYFDVDDDTLTVFPGDGRSIVYERTSEKELLKLQRMMNYCERGVEVVAVEREVRVDRRARQGGKVVVEGDPRQYQERGEYVEEDEEYVEEEEQEMIGQDEEDLEPVRRPPRK